MIQVYSFDVYDTLLTRPFMRPIDLFHEAARALGTAVSPAEYAAARVRAEHAARRAHAPREDIRFTDIFGHFGELSGWGIDPAAAMEAELAAERRFTRPVAATVARARELIESGARVVFLSDMYLPGDFVCERLQAAGVPCGRDAVYVSSDVGRAKYTGGLFEHVLARERVAPGAVEHLGDNARSDVQVPRRLGLRARRFDDIRANRYERAIDDRAAPDHVERSHIAGASRVQRLGGALEALEDAGAARVAANVVAPFLTAYVAWVLRDAAERGIERLYFVSRDGQIFHRIAQALARGRPGPELRYLYGSRQAWFLPSVLQCSPEQIEWSYTAGMSRRGTDILRRLEIDTDGVRAQLAQGGFAAPALEVELAGAAFERFKALLVSEPIAAQVAAHAAAARERQVAYLRQEGLTDGGSWALVDVGWTLKCQRALRTVLRSAGYAGTVQGYYLGISRVHEPVTETGPAQAFVGPEPSAYHGSFDLPAVLAADWFFRLNIVVLLEHLFTMADHPTAKGYEQRDGRWQPVFREETRDADVLEFGARMQRAVVRYADDLARDALVDPCSAVFRRSALDAVADFALVPEPADVTGVAWLPTNKDQSHAREHLSRLASPLSLADLASLVAHELAAPRHRAFFSPEFSWLAGSAAVSSPLVRWLYRAAYGANRTRIGLRHRVMDLLGRRDPDVRAAARPRAAR